MFLRKISSLLIQDKRKFSALYLTGDKANKNYAVLTPYFDFKMKMENTKKLNENINCRHLRLNFPNICDTWNLFKEIEIRKEHLEKQRVEISNSLKIIGEHNNEKAIELKIKGKIVREELKHLKDNSYALEDKFIHDFLSLPNDIHEDTPFGEEPKIIISHNFKNDTINSAYHLNADDVEYLNENCYYLKNKAALLDIRLPFHCVDNFIDDSFIHFSNPDFVRSVLTEAAHLKNLFIVKEHDFDSKINLLHLTGGGSLMSFLGFIAKWSIFTSSLPLELVSCGKQYNSSADLSKGLYSASQSTAVEIFIATRNQKEADQKFKHVIEKISNYYKKFNIHFRILYYPANQLTSAESLKAGLQMYSPYFGCYFEVANLCYYSDYLSKRLLFNVRDGKSYNFPHIIGGTMINVAKLLAILLENNNNKVDLPAFLT